MMKILIVIAIICHLPFGSKSQTGGYVLTNANGTVTIVGDSSNAVRNTINSVVATVGTKANAATTLAGYGITNGVPNTITVNGQALSGNVSITTITGNAGTATALATPRTINGTSFDGTGNITIGNTSVTNAMLAGSIDLTTKVTGILPSANGGTGINNSTRTLTINTNSGTLAFSNASKTLTVANTITLTATDGSTLAIGAGGTLGSNAFNSTAYQPLATNLTSIGALANGSGFLKNNGSGTFTYENPAGAGTVTDASVVSANGFAGTVATSTSTPAITLTTTITGLLKGNGTAISAAAAGTDYLAVNGNGSALTNMTSGQVGLGNVTNESKATMFTSPTFTGTATLPASTSLTTPVIGVATGTSLTATGFIGSTGTAGIGYATGAGGTVTQATNRTTGVTLNKISGAITTNNASLAAGAEASFTVTNSTVAIGDVVIVTARSGQTAATSIPFVTTVANGSFVITLSNFNASTADTGAMVINFLILKAVSN